MFSMRNIILLVVAVLISGGTALYVKGWMEAERSAIKASATHEVKIVATAAAEVLVAKRDLEAGAFIKPENLEWQAWPEDGVHGTYIVRVPGVTGGTDAEDPVTNLDGAVVRVDLKAGEPITKARVVHPGERGFLAAVLEPGFRAVTVPVDATSGIAGFVFPGDWIDLLMTMKVRGADDASRQQRYFSQTVLERVRVLAIDQHVNKEDGEAAVAKTATLEVTPKEAERVALVLDMGRLSLSLNSLSPSESERAHQERLIGGTQPLDPGKVRDGERSYTLDNDIYNMLGDPRLFPKSSSGRQINVVRGSDAVVQTF